jgi:hypothetical protein
VTGVNYYKRRLMMHMTFSFYYVLLYFSIIFFPFYLLDIRPKAKREQKLPFYLPTKLAREKGRLKISLK